MCGIFGYTGAFPAAPLVKQGLIDLTYRGYDSSGIAAQNEHTVAVKKGVGCITAVRGIEELVGTCAIGHTRWATHGAVCEKNAHPFTVGAFTVVHNGIIENFRTLKRSLTEQGFSFSSDTDSEIIAALLCKYGSQGLIGALQAACGQLVGSFAVAAISEKEPNRIACARRSSPLLIGKGKEGYFLSSDANALSPHTRTAISLTDGDFALVSPQSARFFRGKEEIHPPLITLSAPAVQAKTQDCAHFMRKEITEVPFAVTETVRAFTAQEKSAIFTAFQGAKRAVLFGCGTAYHAAVYGKYLFERLCKIPAEAELSSELRYRSPAVTPNTVYIAVSQSGETADTLATVEMLKGRGAPVFAVTNTKESSLARQAGYTFVTQAGTEIGVAATKSFTVQLTAFLLFACALSGKSLPLTSLGDLCRRATEGEEEIAALAAKLSRAKGVFFLGRDLDYPLSMEGSLKLKEISYMFSEGYAAGELKHGTLALVEEGVFVVALATQRLLAEKTMNAVHEVACRGAETALFTPFTHFIEEGGASKGFLLPAAPPEMLPIVASIPLQLIAYHTALCRGYNPDRPRNLAKSVTVE